MCSWNLAWCCVWAQPTRRFCYECVISHRELSLGYRPPLEPCHQLSLGAQLELFELVDRFERACVSLLRHTIEVSVEERDKVGACAGRELAGSLDHERDRVRGQLQKPGPALFDIVP